jgi:hypothetical protein
MPDSDHLLFHPFDGQGNPYLAETAACLNGNCRLEPLAGFPVWSPSGQRTLLAHQREDGTPQLYLGSDQARPFQYLTNGYAPQWLDENSLLYVGENGTAIYNGRIDPSGSLTETERLADISSLFSPQVFDEPRPNPVITSLTVHPAQQTWVIISIAHLNNQPDSLLLLNRQTNRLNFGFSQSNLQFSLPFYFSGDGRFLTIPAFESGTLSGSWELLVFNLDPVAGNWQYTTGTSYFDWSADSQWLLIAEDDALRIIAPRRDYERQIPHNLGCHAVGWRR